MVDVVRVEAEGAGEGQALIGLVHPLRAAFKPQIHNRFRPGASAEKAVRIRIPAQHVEILVQIHRNDVPRDVHVAAADGLHLRAEGRLPVERLERFHVHVREDHVFQRAPRQFLRLAFYHSGGHRRVVLRRPQHRFAGRHRRFRRMAHRAQIQGADPEEQQAPNQRRRTKGFHGSQVTHQRGSEKCRGAGRAVRGSRRPTSPRRLRRRRGTIRTGGWQGR